MNKLEILKGARETIATKGWAKGFFAYDSNGGLCRGWYKDACKFCALGAVEHVISEAGWRENALLISSVWDALQEALPQTDDEDNAGIAEFNDSAESVDDVLVLFDRAIANVEAE